MERSLVLVKPDGVQRGLVGKVITALEDRGLRDRVPSSAGNWQKRVEERGQAFTTPDCVHTSSPVMKWWGRIRRVSAIRQTMGKRAERVAQASAMIASASGNITAPPDSQNAERRLRYGSTGRNCGLV